MHSRVFVPALIFGIEFVAIAALYWMTPASQLPTFLPGYDAGSADILYLRGALSLIVAAPLFTFAWLHVV